MTESSTIETGGVSGERRLVTILFCDLVGSTGIDTAKLPAGPGDIDLREIANTDVSLDS